MTNIPENIYTQFTKSIKQELEKIDESYDNKWYEKLTVHPEFHHKIPEIIETKKLIGIIMQCFITNICIDLKKILKENLQND